MSDAILAVDFGTSTSAAALVADGETILIEEPASGFTSWPSAAYPDGGDLVVGTEAVSRMPADPQSFAAEFKRHLGEDPPVILGDREYAPQALAAEMIRALRDEACR